MAASPQRRVQPYTSSALPPKLDMAVGPKTFFSPPPQTPGSVSANSYALGADIGGLGGCRKRSRQDTSSSSYFTTPYAATPEGLSYFAASSPAAWSEDVASPAPFVNTTYTLAGGLDTPTLAAASKFEDSNNCSDVRFRTRWAEDSGMGLSAIENEDPNGKRSSNPSTTGTTSAGLGQLVVNLVGGVASKMWNFCTSGTFKGFYAGGGRGYEMKPPNQELSTEASVWEDVVDIPPTFSLFGSRSPPLPGQFPEDDFGIQSMEDTPARPFKRLHTDQAAEWVMIPKGGLPNSRPSTPRLPGRRAPGTAAKSHIPRPAVPSRAGPGVRRSLLPVSRRSSLSAGSPAHQRRSSVVISPRAREYNREGYESPAIPPLNHGSPLSAEAQRYVARKSREEREADASMRKLNAQLQAMIKEGKEALGTKFEIEGDVEDDNTLGDYLH